MIRRLAPALLTMAALATLGCGAGAGQQAGNVQLIVTRDFGSRELLRVDAPEQGGDDTVMRVLQRNADVKTRYGGGFVQSIDGLGGGTEEGRPVDWFYFVNGVEAEKGATSTKVDPGEQIWWDRRDWSAAQRVPAVVGSFPEPFKTGIDGKRLPVRIECSDVKAKACDAVADIFTKLGVVAARGTLGAAETEDTLRVVVGPWKDIQQFTFVARQVAKGPKVSGVFARFADGGDTLITLNAQGRPVQRLGAATGLVAAGREGEDAPTWLVTGTDAAGVDSAVTALDESALQEKFALAISNGRGVALPEQERRVP